MIEAEVEPAEPADEPSRPPRPARVPPPSQKPQMTASPEEPVIRTGSSDRHYERTETPVDPEPVRRPRSYRDLDAIPDDLD